MSKDQTRILQTLFQEKTRITLVTVAGVLAILLVLGGFRHFQKQKQLKSLDAWAAFTKRNDVAELVKFADSQGKTQGAFWALLTAAKESEKNKDFAKAYDFTNRARSISHSKEAQSALDLKLCFLQEATDEAQALGCFDRIATQTKSAKALRLEAMGALVRLKLKKNDDAGAKTTLEEMRGLDSASEITKWAGYYVSVK